MYIYIYLYIIYIIYYKWLFRKRINNIKRDRVIIFENIRKTNNRGKYKLPPQAYALLFLPDVSLTTITGNDTILNGEGSWRSSNVGDSRLAKENILIEDNMYRSFHSFYFQIPFHSDQCGNRAISSVNASRETIESHDERWENARK